jgi:diguanylate cyclase (GGDEF)-like protein
MSDFWQRRSLKFWLATGILMTSLPMLIAATAGYVLYHNAIIDPLVEVASRQRDILRPLQDLQLQLWDINKSVNDYAVDGRAGRAVDYRRESKTIDAAFVSLAEAVEGHGLEADDIKQAHADWLEVAVFSDSILASAGVHRNRDATREVEELEDSVDSLGKRLDVVFNDLRLDNENTHETALADLARSDDMALAGFGLSIIFAMIGIYIVNKSLVTSMNSLASGALRLAAGDRDHRIKVHIPHELVNVAEAFNVMTGQILAQERALERAATTDGLTGLLNRREFDRVLAEELRRGARYGSALSIAIGDVDHFKKLNDTHGHQAGDEVLRIVSRTLRMTVRDVDKVFRFGGEEFVLLLPESDAAGALQTAERVRAAIEEMVVPLANGTRVRVSISLGVATHPVHGGTPDELLKNADAALYESKAKGRNRVSVSATQRPGQELRRSYRA